MTKDERIKIFEHRYTGLDFQRRDCMYCLKPNHVMGDCRTLLKDLKKKPSIQGILGYI